MADREMSPEQWRENERRIARLIADLKAHFETRRASEALTDRIMAAIAKEPPQTAA